LVAVASLLAAPTQATAGDGDRDPSFHFDGVLRTNYPCVRRVEDIAIQPADQKIVAVARRCGDSQDDGLIVLRYKPNGTLDQTFSGDGMLINRGFRQGHAIAVQPDGRILVAGEAEGHFGVARYRSNGKLDPTFGGDGMVVVRHRAGEIARDLAIQDDGRIVVAGEGHRLDGRGHSRFVVHRYTRSGKLDSTFTGEGAVVTGLGPNHGGFGEALALQPDGKIVVVGFADLGIGVVRYNRNGSLDQSFAGDGKLIRKFEGETTEVSSVAIQPDEKIIVGAAARRDFVIMRLTRNGKLDSTFDGNGWVRTRVTDNGDHVLDVAVEADGRILAAGYSRLRCCWSQNAAVVRYTRSGRLDRTFSGDGVATVTDGGWEAVAIQADGRIVAGGYGHPSGRPLFARYLSS
jgi:uncharacterized delta-60 repeat protein